MHPNGRTKIKVSQDPPEIKKITKYVPAGFMETNLESDTKKTPKSTPPNLQNHGFRADWASFSGFNIYTKYNMTTSTQRKKSAAEGGLFLRLSFHLLYICFLGIQIRKCRLASYLNDHHEKDYLK